MMGRPRRDWPKRVRVRDVSLYVDVVGHGNPLVLMHGGPSADLWTMGAFRELADQSRWCSTTTAATAAPSGFLSRR